MRKITLLFVILFSVTVANCQFLITAAGNVNSSGVSLGSELVTDGAMTSTANWLEDTGWTVTGGVADCSGSQEVVAKLYQAEAWSSDISVRFDFDILNYSAGNVRIKINSTTFSSYVSGNGNHIIDVTIDSDYDYIVLEADVNFDAEVDNLSVKQIL